MGRNNPPGGEPVKKRRRRRTVPPEVKKDNHKERERARRNLIKDRFAYLRATIPTLGENAHKMARTEVLDHVIDYIQGCKILYLNIIFYYSATKYCKS